VREEVQCQNWHTCTKVIRQCAPQQYAFQVLEEMRKQRKYHVVTEILENILHNIIQEKTQPIHHLKFVAELNYHINYVV